jgi:Xaa-Pro aminopeptidase
MMQTRSASFMDLPPLDGPACARLPVPKVAICYSVMPEPGDRPAQVTPEEAAMPQGHADRQPAVVSGQVTMAPPVPRLERVTGWMREQALDALVATGTDLVTWLTGYSRYYGGPSAVVVDPSGERTLVVLRDEVPVAERLAGADRVTGYGERGFGLELNPLPLLAAAVRTVAAVASASRVGAAGEDAGQIAGEAAAAAVPAGDVLHHMSLVKDGDELTKIFHAYELCWLAHAAVADGARAGASEIEMMSAAQAAAQVAHGEPIEFGADLLAAGNTAQVCGPIAVAGRTRSATGAPVIADICVRADGYWADTCRTHVPGGSSEIDDIRHQLRDILAAAAGELRAGATGADVFKAMRARIAAAWPDGEFPHHGGHGVGLSVFDDPHVIPSDPSVLENWMVMALEPGVYLPGRFGVRHENLFLVTPDGAVELAEAMRRPLSDRALSAWTA